MYKNTDIKKFHLGKNKNYQAPTLKQAVLRGGDKAYRALLSQD